MKVAEFINAQLRPFSMYAGMVLGLSGIWLVALVLSFVGLLDFSPLAMMVSMVVLVASTYLTSLLCAKLFGVNISWESSVITGLILALIFLPVIELPQLIVLAFVGMIAGASKFIVTWRGRHIFNPAAFAAVVIGFTSLGAATWWVATPVLTPIVLLTVLISLYKTKRYLVVGIFLAITIPALLIQFLLFGASLEESLFLLLSWPLLFLAGIMLTEPLTLPPRKWQMYIVAAVVAVLFLLPLEIGEFRMTPALALLGGNILAAIFAGRHIVQLKFKERRTLTPTTDELIFTPNIAVSYLPGQYMEINAPHTKADLRGIRRSFSMTSEPSEKNVSFGVKFYEPSSTLKKSLRALKSGDTLNVTQIGGDFVLPKDTTRPLLFIAGGIGVTPFISHLKSLKKATRDIVLVYSASNPDEVAYKDILKKSGIRVIETSRINYEELVEMIPDIAERWAYASGPVPFVQDAKHKLRKLGVRSVKTDYFVGY